MLESFDTEEENDRFNEYLKTVNPLEKLNNPRKITGLIVFYSGKPQEEVELTENQAFQETVGKIELWQREKHLMHRVKGWMKKNITHVKINNQYQPI